MLIGLLVCIIERSTGTSSVSRMRVHALDRCDERATKIRFSPELTLPSNLSPSPDVHPISKICWKVGERVGERQKSRPGRSCTCLTTSVTPQSWDWPCVNMLQSPEHRRSLVQRGSTAPVSHNWTSTHTGTHLPIDTALLAPSVFIIPFRNLDPDMLGRSPGHQSASCTSLMTKRWRALMRLVSFLELKQASSNLVRKPNTRLNSFSAPKTLSCKWFPKSTRSGQIGFG